MEIFLAVVLAVVFVSALTLVWAIDHDGEGL